MRQKLIDCRGENSRQKVSKDLGITPQMLGAIERGDRTPSLHLAKNIAEYYGLSIDEIFFNDKETNRFLI
ncbi:transcriptional regulator [Virgibacillus dokdonensis]|uniref:Transcriptional regulator n=1 Tax=Virgibacillus dokdonensis TaxID=302167 RepID=A0A3E0WIG7_9BACI|nr:helix-turn-helix domain-containing protein [Virgibacillus dokdonensis]RFA31917.1 transcriptional regulator [Virgibacillus dokdonensis]